MKRRKHFLPLLGSSPRLSNKISDWPLVISPIAKNRLYSTFSVSAQKDPALSCHRESRHFFCMVILTKYSLVSSFQSSSWPSKHLRTDLCFTMQITGWERRLRWWKFSLPFVWAQKISTYELRKACFKSWCVKEGIQIIKPRENNAWNFRKSIHKYLENKCLSI